MFSFCNQCFIQPKLFFIIYSIDPSKRIFSLFLKDLVFKYFPKKICNEEKLTLSSILFVNDTFFFSHAWLYFFYTLPGLNECGFR